MEQHTWRQLRGKLVETIGQNNFANWIEPLEFESLDGDTATFLAPTNFIGDWVQRNFGERILSLLCSNGRAVSRLRFAVPQDAGLAEPAARQCLETAYAVDGSDVPGAHLNPHFTFDRFVVGKPNELAHAAARRVGEGNDAAFNPLFLYGGVGLGKTHLMHAVAHELKARVPAKKVVYLSAEQFMYRFIQALRDKRMIDFKQLFRSVDILMVDDVQFIAGKESTQEEFFHTFNALIDQKKQIVISADRAPGEIRNLEERIRSRLQSGLIVDLHPTDYELRLGILQQKTEFQRVRHGHVPMSGGVLEFLAPPNLHERPGSGRRADAAFRLCGSCEKGHYPGPDTGMSF